MKKKVMILLSALLSMSLVTVGCSKQGGSATTNKPIQKQDLKKNVTEVIKATNPEKLPEQAKNRKDTLIVGTTAPEGKFNPIYASSVYDGYVNSLVFSALISADAQGNPIPDVAEKWEISPDGKTYTFYLKKGVKFSDGKELTAKDVAFTYTALCDPKYDGPRQDAVDALLGYEEYNKGNAKEVSGIKVIDDYTISFTLKKVKASAIWNFSYGILSKDYYGFEKGGFQKIKDLFGKPMGSGPYIFKQYKAGQEVDFERNPNYFKGEPKIPYVIMKATNSQTNIQELISGGIDADTVAANPENAQMIKSAGFLTQQLYPRNGYYYLGLNLRNDMFKDKRVRQALMYGLNRQGFNDAFYKGYGTNCNAPISPVSWAYTDELNKYEYNPEKAKKLLDEAGWKLGNDGYRYKDGKKFTIHWSTSTGSKYADTLIPIVKENWKDLGIEVIPEAMEFSTLASKVYDKLDFEMYNMGWSLSIDPDPSGIFDVSQIKPGGNNSVGWNNPEAQKLIEEGLATTDQAKRKEIYKKWLQIANDDLPYLFLSQYKDMFVVSSRVKNMNVTPYQDWTKNIYKVELAN